eukprot:523475_1
MKHLRLSRVIHTMSRSIHTNLTPTMYLFHHHGVEIDTKSLKHSDAIFPIEWSANKESKIDSWNIELYKSRIKTKWLSQTFVFSDTMESTQSYTKQNALTLA